MRPIPAAALALAACGSGAAPEREAAAERIDCRPAGATAFAPVCAVERTAGEGSTLLTIRKPDGGFRRLLVAADGRGVAAADGAEEAEATMLGRDVVQVEIGGDAFRLPPSVRAP